MSKKSVCNASARLIKSVSLLAIMVSLSACASGTVRFNDGFYTGAVPKQSVGSVQTPFPSAVPQQTYRAPTYQQPPYQPQYQPQYQAQQPVYAPVRPAAPNYQNVDRTYTGSVPSQPSVMRQALAAPRHSVASLKSEPAPAPAPVAAPAQPRQIAAAAPIAVKTKEGWTAAGGTYVTMREGETVYNLAKRYGVPANAILEANGLSNPSAVQAGSKIIIPTYVYSRTAPASMPDANAQTRAASSNIGGRSEFPVGVAPVPSTRPSQVQSAQGTQVASLAPKIPATALPKPSDNGIKTGKYTVSSGDTLSAIARRSGTSSDAIKRLNGLPGDNLRIGQSLLIPGIDGTLSSAAKVAAARAGVDKTTTSTKPNVAAYTPPKAKVTDKGSIMTIDNGSTASTPSATGVETMRWPVKGRVVSSFGSNVGGKGNDGIDISVPSGTSVKAAENGAVIYAGDGLKEFGKTVLVRHGDGLVTVYGHLSSISVERGANVSRGQSLGVSGMTGSAKQPQLHFEVRKNTTPVNPITYLN